MASVRIDRTKADADPTDFSNSLETKTGTLIGVPIPEEFEQKSSLIQTAVEQAIEAAQANGIAKRGKEVTPWILAKVKELTGGDSVESSRSCVFAWLTQSLICYHRSRPHQEQRCSRIEYRGRIGETQEVVFGE